MKPKAMAKVKTSGPVATCQPVQSIPDKFHTRHTTCHCGGKLLEHHSGVTAKCYDLVGVKDVTITTYRCSRKNQGCGVAHSANFYFEKDMGNKINTVNADDLKGMAVLFTSNKRCFTLRMLEYHSNLAFRGFLSASAVDWSYKATFGDQDQQPVQHAGQHGANIQHDFRKELTTAIVYYLAIRELSAIGMEKQITVGDEITADVYEKLNKHYHEHVLKPDNSGAIDLVVGDGNAKVLTRCGADTQAKKKESMKRTGRPRKHKKAKPSNMSHGWYMMVVPTGQIVQISQMLDPEDHEIVTHALESTVERFPNLNCFVYDRACAYAPKNKTRAAFKKIKHWCVDKFHARRHNKRCKCSPRNVPSIRRRLRGVNTVCAEQAFSWFRGYARTLNDMNEYRHKFLVLVFTRMHIEAVKKGDTAHLNAYAPLQSLSMKRSRPYACTKAKPKACTKVKKRMMKAKK